MDYVNKLVKSMRNASKMNSDDCLMYSSYAIFGLSALYIFYNGQIATVGLAIGVALIMYVVTSKNLEVSLIAGALAGLIAVHYSRLNREGFTTEGEEEAEEEGSESNGKPKPKAKPAKKEAFEGNKALAPNNGERAEFFELGKKYKAPSEDDDKDFHLDAGTTFMNAYKSLKPDQIAAMTKDTQELMQTQKQLMSTLSTLKPLIQDGKQMMDMFQSYLGGSPSAN